MNYSKLNNQCVSETKAFTSNTKFYPPLSSIYWEDWVPIYKLNGDIPLEPTNINLNKKDCTCPSKVLPKSSPEIKNSYHLNPTICSSCGK